MKYRSFEVCASHFSPEDLRTVTKLMPNALPCRNLPSQADNHDMQIEEEIIAKIAEDISENSQDSPIEKFDFDHKRNSDDELPDPEEVKKKLMENYVKVKTEHDTKKLVTVCAPLNNDEITELLVEWQNNMDNRNNNKEYYHFCLNIFLSSPQIYTSLRSLLRLPNQRMLSRVVLHSKPKIDKRILTCLSSKLQSLPVKAKYCTLCIDQIPLKPHLFYNITQDEIIGFKTHGIVTREVVRHAYVAVLRGIVVDWSQPIAHCMLAISCSNDLHRWIMEVINVLYGRGIEVKAIVSKLEIGVDTNVKTDKPYTSFKPYNSAKLHKVYYIFDVPNLISSVKYYLRENNFHDSGNTISWKYIEEAYFYQKRHGLKLLPEVTRGHLEIKSNVDQRKRDKQTADIFSQSMVAAINVLKMQTVESTENMESSNAEATSKFVETVSKTFNILNSSSIKNCDKYQRPFTGSVSQSKALAEALEMFDRIRVVSKDPENDSSKAFRLFVNIQVSIQAIQCLFEDLHAEGIPFILTQRLNREPLDDIVKEVTGKTSKPTPLRFLRAYSKVILSRFLKKSPMRNKQADLADLLLVGNSVLLQETLPRPPTSKVSIGPETDYRFDLPDKDSLTYVTSYLLYKCSTKHVCPVLTKIMNISPDLYRVHPQFKAINSNCVSFYAYLKLPPKLFENYIKDLDEIFKKKFEQIMPRSLPANVLLKVLHDVEPCTPCLDFNVDYLLILFTRLRIYQILRYNSQCVRRPPFVDYKTNRVTSKFKYIQFSSLN